VGKCLLEIGFFVVNAGHVVIQYDFNSGRFIGNSLSFLQPFLSLANLTAFGVLHSN